ncbi:MAG: hypothetical protein J7K68_02090 [Candidatus Diapherotrites archaeon]|nr:hypothetical protein [Candidatus Diapherotrites archaeon]
MPAQDFRKNLPHLIALAVLLFALIIVATKAGIMRCSDLGNSYCDVYYTIVGKPKVMIIYDPDDNGAMGDVRALARIIQDQNGVPVRLIDIDKVSAGMLKDYDVVVVEHARRIPTEKLLILKEYVFNDMGRLVWVGNSGTIGANKDQLCKTVEYSVKWTQVDGTHIEDKTSRVCVKEGDIPFDTEESVSQRMAKKKEALVEKAWGQLESICEDAFQGTLSNVKKKDGYPCEIPSNAKFSNVYINWKNEETFKEVVNPWVRGEYEVLGKEKTDEGIDFGGTVLGISFIADDYAVKEYTMYSKSITDIQKALVEAHIGFVECSNSIRESTCNIASKQATVFSDLSSLKGTKNNAETMLNGFVSTLNSMAVNKENQNESAAATIIRNAANEINAEKESIKSITFETDEIPTQEVMTNLENMKIHVQNAKNQLIILKGSETDDTVIKQYDSMIAQCESTIHAIDTEINALNTHISEYNDCLKQSAGTLSDELSKGIGDKEKADAILGYASPLIDEGGIVNFILEVTDEKGIKPEWKTVKEKLEAMDPTVVCRSNSTKIKEGFLAAAEAIELAGEARESINPQKEATSMATLQAADEYHALVQGISKSIELVKEGPDGKKYPVPFVLVQTSHAHTYTVTQLKITPEYKGIGEWPAITVKDPKFGTHSFGRGVVVFYAFPPETDEIFVNNLVEYILY